LQEIRDVEWISEPQTWIAFFTLTALELVLGIDNIVFISILAGKLPSDQQQKARVVGLGLAMFIRVALLFSLTWIIRLTAPLFVVLDHEISGRDLILIAGGLFLLAKSTHEIHQKLEGEEGHASARVAPSFVSVIVQILMLDAIFSLDSVITAIGMVSKIEIMIAAVVVSIGFMMLFAGSIGAFVERHPTVKMLALSFLLLIGVTLIAEGFDQHISKGYIYFAMAFSVFVEMLNLRLRKSRTPPVKLHEPYVGSSGLAGAPAE
jgi:predicted tellurium resistance membrane protein TerC